MERHELEALFLAHLGAIDRIIAVAARQRGIRGADADEFASWTRLRLIEHDYAILGKFRGQSALTTYLTIVIVRLAQEFRTQQWGRWRSSAAARRLGPLAVRLERLVYRDGYRIDEAGELLRTAGETALSDRELAALLAELPVRDAQRREPTHGDDPPDAVADATCADERVLQEEADRERRVLEDALHRVLAELPEEDRVILRLRFWEGSSVADIARALRLAQPPLYRRLERLKTMLGQALEAAGVSREQIRRLLDEARPPEEPPGDNPDPRPSNEP